MQYGAVPRQFFALNTSLLERLFPSSPRCSSTAAGSISSVICCIYGFSGITLEDQLGHGRFLLFYLLCGLAAALTQSLS